MKILRATTKTQGQRANDFSWTDEGEIVNWGAFECDREEVDGHCGCRRSLCGLNSLKATTTFIVTNEPHMTRSDLILLIVESMERGGWGTKDGVLPLAKQNAMDISAIASGYPEGTILERRGDWFNVRKEIINGDNNKSSNNSYNAQ